MDQQLPPGLGTRDLLIESGRQYLKFAVTHPEHYLLMFNMPDLPYGTPADIRHNPQFAPVVTLVEQGV
jgi:hypothetical protein